jgi:prepilin-type N-terminal cleavage/methylation domain-containing protein
MTPEQLPTRRRRAFTLMEVIAVTAMLGVVLGLTAQVLGAVNRHAQAAEHQAIALRTLENCLERITNLPWEDLEPAAIEATLLPGDLRSRWPKAKLTGAVKIVEGPLEAKQITLRLSLTGASRSRAARLTTWVYRTLKP